MVVGIIGRLVTVPDPIGGDTCPGGGCSNPVLAIIGVLPTPQLRTAAFLAFLRTEVARRSAKEHTR